jgi:hypothetical protein
MQNQKEKIPEKNGEVIAGKSVTGNDLEKILKSNQGPKFF